MENNISFPSFHNGVVNSIKLDSSCHKIATCGNDYFLKNKKWGLGIGDWGLGIGDWAQSQIPNPQSPIPNPQ